MPGYLTDPASYASGIAITASGNISAPNVQSAIYELDSEKADVSSTTSALALKAPLASPTFTGTVSASVANVSSNLTVDTNTLFVDAANNKVGIGTISPTQTLQVDGISFLNGKVVAGRENNASEGGQISLSRSTDNGEYWNIDVYGNTSTPSLRFHNDGTVKMQIDSSGRVTLPYQPMFSARSNGETHTATSVIPFSVTYFNIGSHFNTSTYRFTAPVAGTYNFFCNLLMDSSNTVKNEEVIRFRVNQQNIGRSQWGAFPVASLYFQGSASAMINLAAGDYVDVVSGFKIYTASTGAHTWFSGHLVG